MGFFSKMKEKLSGGEESHAEEGHEEGYVEIEGDEESLKTKITVRPFVLTDFEDIKDILDSLREGNTIALVNIRPLKDKDLMEPKRAINKLKKTADAIDGEIAGFGEDWIVVTPAFAQIYRSSQVSAIKSDEETA